MNFQQYGDKTLNVSRDEFEESYEAPFEINGFYLDELEGRELYDLYKESLRSCNTIPEMMREARKFGFLAWGAVAALNRLSNYWVEPIKQILTGGHDAYIKQYELDILVHIVLPKNILMAGTVSDKYGLPAYYAGLQYVRATVYGEKADNND